MRSPLPDSTSLEEGLVADPPSPYRTTNVQNTVRSLLRASVFGKLSCTSNKDDEETIQIFSNISVLDSGIRESSSRLGPNRVDARSTASILSASFISCPQTPVEDHDGSPPFQSPKSPVATTVVLQPTQPAQSSRLEYPDIVVSDPALNVLAHHNQRRRNHCERQRHHHRRQTRAKSQARGMLVLYCTVSGLLLGALLSTYLAIVLDHHNLGTLFHVLFIISIMITTILFCHAIVRLVLFSSRSRSRAKVRARKNLKRAGKPRLPHFQFPGDVLGTHTSGIQNHNRNNHVVPGEETDFVPSTPIRVHFSGDNGTPPVATNGQGVKEGQDVTPRVMPDGVLFPPPAYGRWRGSARVDPNLVHWQRADGNS